MADRFEPEIQLVLKAIFTLSAAAWLGLSAQAPITTSADVAFEVASIKPNTSGNLNSSTSGRAGSFTATNITARQLIVYAYRLREFQIAGGPGWMRSDRFDILARSPETGKPDNPMMTRALLRDRFKLVAHTETRQEQVYALVTARPDGKLGAQIKPSTHDCQASQPGTPSPCGMNSSVNQTVGSDRYGPVDGESGIGARQLRVEPDGRRSHRREGSVRFRDAMDAGHRARRTGG